MNNNMNNNMDNNMDKIMNMYRAKLQQPSVRG